MLLPFLGGICVPKVWLSRAGDSLRAFHFLYFAEKKYLKAVADRTVIERFFRISGTCVVNMCSKVKYAVS